MVRQFEIILIRYHHNRGAFFFARHLGEQHDFIVEEGSLFGNIPVYQDTNFKPTNENEQPRDEPLRKGEAWTQAERHLARLQALLAPGDRAEPLAQHRQVDDHTSINEDDPSALEREDERRPADSHPPTAGRSASLELPTT